MTGRLPIIALCGALLLAASAFAARPATGPAAGRALSGELRALSSALQKVDGRRADTGDSLLEEVGFDGETAWYWPDLPGQSGRFQRQLTLPVGGRVAGVSLVSYGGSAERCRLRLLDETGASLFDSTGVSLDGSGRRETVLVNRALELSAGSRLTIEFARDSLSPAPWFSADDDCYREGRSWLRIGAEDVELDRDLSFRLLLHAGEVGDTVAPRLRPGAPETWGVENRRLPLSAIARDATGVDSVFVETDDGLLPALRLTRLGVDDADSTQSRWRGELNTALLRPAAGDTVSGRFVAWDGAGNRTEEPFAVVLGEGYDWSRESGRDEASLLPAWPGVPGMAVAMAMPFAAIPDVQGTVVVGAWAKTRGAGEFSLRLVQDDGGEPKTIDGAFAALSDTVFVTRTAACEEGATVDFVFPDSLRELQGSRVWVVLRWESFPNLLSPPTLLAEAADSLEGFDAATAPAFVYDPVHGWSPLAHAVPLLRARLDVQSCVYDLEDGALVQTFEQAQNLSGLRCWSRSSTGLWELSRGNVVNSSFFAPDSGGAQWKAEWDESDIQNGEFAYLRSDGLAGLRVDTLFTPPLAYTGDVVDVSLLSYFSNYYVPEEYDDDELAQILVRSDGADVSLGAWSVLADEETFAAVHPDSMLRVQIDDEFYEYPGPIWSEFDTLAIGLPTDGVLQLAFAYRGNNAFGWAIDSVVVSLPGANPVARFFDGAATRTAELGRVHPNPFNPSTTIPYRVLASGPVELGIFNLLGQRVATLVDEPYRRAGVYTTSWEPQGQASGLYILRLEAGGTLDHRRLLYMK